MATRGIAPKKEKNSKLQDFISILLQKIVYRGETKYQ